MVKKTVQALPSFGYFAKSMARKISLGVSAVLVCAALIFCAGAFYLSYTFKTQRAFEAVQGHLGQLIVTHDFSEITRSLQSLIDADLITGFQVRTLPERAFVTS